MTERSAANRKQGSTIPGMALLSLEELDRFPHRFRDTAGVDLLPGLPQCTGACQDGPSWNLPAHGSFETKEEVEE